MNNASRAAIIWGMLCFLLLYRTLPIDITLSWQVFRQYDIPVSQWLVSFATQALPALMPLAIFLWLARRQAGGRLLTLTLPFLAYLLTQLAVTVVAYVIAAKSGLLMPYSEGFLPLLRRWLDIQWISAMLVCVLTIGVCSYAFWREGLRLK